MVPHAVTEPAEKLTSVFKNAVPPVGKRTGGTFRLKPVDDTLVVNGNSRIVSFVINAVALVDTPTIVLLTVAPEKIRTTFPSTVQSPVGRSIEMTFPTVEEVRVIGLVDGRVAVRKAPISVVVTALPAVVWIAPERTGH